MSTEKVISTKEITDHLENRMIEMLEHFKNDVKDNTTWSISKQSKECTVKNMYKNIGRGKSYPVYMSIGEIPIHTKELIDKVLLEIKYVKQWTNIEDIVILESKKGNYFDQIDIYHQKHASALGGMISARDFTICRCWKFEENGELWSVCQSVDDERLPPSKDFIRGDLLMQGWHAIPDEEKNNISKVEFLVQVDIKGSLPTWVVSQGTVREMGNAIPYIQQIKYN